LGPGKIGPSWAVATSENLVNTAGQHKKEEFVGLKLSKGIPEPEWQRFVRSIWWRNKGSSLRLEADQQIGDRLRYSLQITKTVLLTGTENFSQRFARLETNVVSWGCVKPEKGENANQL